MIVASRDHYRAHLEPIAAELGAADVTLVAGYGDLVDARRRHLPRIVLAQHGAGQSYSGTHPHYPGGARNEGVSLFLAPNTHSADRWRRAYPQAPVAAVGCPRLDTLPRREGHASTPVVALAFHWDLALVPETRSALSWYAGALPALAARYAVIGTGHPRRRDLREVYGRAGIEYVPDFLDVCRRADLLIFDNTSAGYEFAATGRPVVVLDAPWYRREVDHGLRFWEAADVGVRIEHPVDLFYAVERALGRRPADAVARERALDAVYAFRSGAARRAAHAIREWVA